MVGVTPGPCNTSESSGSFEEGPVFIGEAVVVSGIFISEGCLLGFELFEFALVGATIVLGDWPDELLPGAAPTTSPFGATPTVTLFCFGFTTG